MWLGKEYLKQGDYRQAKQYFEASAGQIRDSISLTYIAFVNYKLGRQEEAERLIKEAEAIKHNDYHFLRTLGYKTLILMKKDKAEGIKALKDYLDNYENLHPLPSIEDVQRMSQKGDINSDILERLIQEQVNFYEDAVEQFLSTGTGPFDGIYGVGSEL